MLKIKEEGTITGEIPMEVDRDLHWEPKKASEVKLIAECQGWKYNET